MFRPDEKITNDNDDENKYIAYVGMEDLLEKLKILNYEVELIAELKMKPIHKYYFVTSKNPGEQFYLFASVAAWLIRKSGQSIETPQEYDDPNIVITNILDKLRENNVTIDFSLSKLKQGVGEHVVFVLNTLADKALSYVGFQWKKPKTPEEKDDETEVIDDECEIILDRVEEEMLAAYSDDSEEENIFNMNNLNGTKNGHNHEFDIGENVDVEAWKLELERVLPYLKVTIKNDNRDWRAHFEQMKSYRASNDNSLNFTKTHLDKLHKDIVVTLEKISNRERYLNKELEPVLDEYRLLQDQLSKVKENYQNINGGVMERTRHLAHLSEKIDTLIQQMEERGSSMTDGTPLVNIKKGIAKIKAEISEMDVRIAVLDCILLQSKMKEKTLLEHDLYKSTKYV
uniref:Intraflagellar transport protein 57 homolog n=1 Tax=Photinus pyralis TaxID=7054 RepID=A0A1Y1MR29_PHOPY